MSRTIVCYIEGHGTDWEAICTDLDISVQDTSFEAARASLLAAIDSYVKRVEAMPENERALFYNRKAPWVVRLGFKLRLLTGALFPRLGGPNSGHAEFAISCPA